MLPQLGQVIVDCKINLGIRVGLHLVRKIKPIRATASSMRVIAISTIISYRVDIA
jgi:hypothetical protein